MLIYQKNSISLHHKTNTIKIQNEKMETIKENNHPSRHDIIGKSKEELLNRRHYIVAAIEAWKENRYNATPDRVAYNINYFEVELQIVDKELKTKE